MIARICGTVLEALPNRLTINVNGVGYQAIVPLSTLDALHPSKGQTIDLHTYLHVRENALTLYGFASSQEKDLFLLLIERVSGIGPSIGLAILSGMPIEAFKTAVINNDAVSLAQVKGLGKKTAERIILELKDKIGIAETWQITPTDPAAAAATDAELALIALGYKQTDARKAVTKAVQHSSPDSTDDLLRVALRLLN